MNYQKGDRPNSSRQPVGPPAELWQTFVQQLGADRNTAPGWYLTIENSRFVKENQGEIVIALPVDIKLNPSQAQMLRSAISRHKNYPFESRNLTFKSDDPAQMEVVSPLQKLNHKLLPRDEKGQEREAPVLELAAHADATCQPLYTLLGQRTEQLADALVIATFPWRLRVGGLQGFRERLLPVFHPVYGIPYVPSSSIKGALRTWAREHLPNPERQRINTLLGYLDGNGASLGTVQILDAFPTSPCLSLDVATPQWAWTGDRVQYGTVPHAMLSMKAVTLKIGLAHTSLGTVDDVNVVKTWLEQALLSTGLGSRVSAGYGRASTVNAMTRPSQPSRYSSEHNFGLWSQGIYGALSQQREFRPAAVRGMLRYWFRAIALGLYSPEHCKDLEHQLFGTLEPSAVHGSLNITVQFEEEPTSLTNPRIPHKIAGTIILATQQEAHLRLIEQVLQLAMHLGGVGRGARRSLHWNDDGKFSGLRGCYWQPDAKDRLGCNKKIWADFLKSLKASFMQVLPPDPINRLSLGDPGHPDISKKRFHDVLNAHANIFLVPCPRMMHPDQLATRWPQEGYRPHVRGAALEFLYTNNPTYKGVNRQGQGNASVGGKLGTPSFVWIASNNLNIPQQAYQVVTIFGTNHSAIKPPGRQQFVEALQDEHNGLNTISVWDV